MAITLINVAKLSSSGAATTIAAPATNHTANNLLFVFARHGTNSTSTISISDTAGNTFTQVDALIGNAAAGAAQAFYAKNILGNASNVVTATFGTSVSFRGITVLQYSGLDTVSPLDAHITGNGTFTTAIVSGTFSTAFANEVVIQAATTDGAAGYTAKLIGGSQSTLETASTDDPGVEDIIFSSTKSSITAEIDDSAGANFIMQVATFKAAFTFEDDSFTQYQPLPSLVTTVFS